MKSCEGASEPDKLIPSSPFEVHEMSSATSSSPATTLRVCRHENKVKNSLQPNSFCMRINNQSESSKSKVAACDKYLKIENFSCFPAALPPRLSVKLLPVSLLCSTPLHWRKKKLFPSIPLSTSKSGEEASRKC